MIRKGYVEDQIQQMATVIARILTLRAAGDTRGSEKQMRDASRRLAGMELSMLTSLTDDSLIRMLQGSGSADNGRCFVAGTLLDEYANLLNDAHQAAESLSARGRALLLMASALAAEPALRTPERCARLAVMLEDVPPANQSPTALRHTYVCAEACGLFADAENALHEMKRMLGDGWPEEARAFYGRLLERNDDELAAGGLSRGEVTEAMQEIAAEASQ